MDDNKNKRPAITSRLCFTYFLFKTLAIRKTPYSKLSSLSIIPIKKINKLDKIFPFLRLLGKITCLAILYPKRKISIIRRNTLLIIFFISFMFFYEDYEGKCINCFAYLLTIAV